ncbi:MAG: hydrogenase maturation peptidase HycI [Candidatus Woesearchaeota archaeon]
MLYLLAFGNPYLKEDNLALEIADAIIADKIKGIEVVKCVSPEEVLHYTDKEFYILDVVKDLHEVRVFDDINKINARNIVSMHDFDLGFFLKLMKETGQIDKVNIIGVPQEGDIKVLKDEVIKVISADGRHIRNSDEDADFVLVGVGNSMGADDGIGCYIAEEFKARKLQGWRAINCGTVPENFTSVIRKGNPKRIIIVDSAEMKLAPREFRMIPKEKLSKLALTTHAMPLSVLIEYLEGSVPEVIFIGIQPKHLGTGTKLSNELLKSAGEIIKILEDKRFKDIKRLE